MQKIEQIKTVAETMATIAHKSHDAVLSAFGHPMDATLCERLADVLLELGVHEPHVEWFFDMECDEKAFRDWISLVVENPGPEA